ncbi:MAG: hypothetical protein ABEI97_01560 [Candidatus Nanohaloarchaea archaeon]
MPDDPIPAGPDGPDVPESVVCPICEEEFEDPQDLEEHITAEHQGEADAGV